MSVRKIIGICILLILVIVAVVSLLPEKQATATVYTDPEELRGKTVAISTGTISEEVVKRYFNGDVKVTYYNGEVDLPLSLEKGTADAYATNLYVAQYLCTRYGHTLLAEIPLDFNDSGYLFNKDSEKSRKLCSQMNEMIAEYKASGKFEEIIQKWVNNPQQVIDIPLTGKNGTLQFACSTNLGIPFCYMYENQLVGIDVEIAYLFCEKYGYKLEVTDYDFQGMIAAVAAGKVDFGGTDTTITEERKKQCLFSDSYRCAPYALVVSSTGTVTSDKEIYNSADELAGKTVGVVIGTVTDKSINAYFDGNIKLEYFQRATDMPIAMQKGKIDAYCSNVYNCRYMCMTYTDQRVLEEQPMASNPVGFMFTKNNERSLALLAQMNAMIAEYTASGKIDEITQKWVENQYQKIDIPLTGENGTVRYACTTAVGIPFCFVQDNQLVGSEVEIVYLFCQKYGYDLEIADYDYSGMIAAVASAKADFGGTDTCISEERQKQCQFSDAYRYIDFTLTVNKATDTASETGFFQGIVDSLYSNFIVESRWKLSVSGIGVTLLITISAILLGSVLGLGVFFISFDGEKTVNRIIDFFLWLVHGMPVVVFLMVMYYILFAKSTLSNIIISIIAFTIIFACSCIKMLRISYSGLSKGQTDAAISLGYTPFQAVWKRLLPQMIVRITPTYKVEMVSLLKATSVVGYIAVQDLTKASDIIRGCTYEAFFPLIATTILYFILAAILKVVAEKLLQCFDTHRRTKEQILKGVNCQ